MLEQTRARYRAKVYAARVYACVLMPEHIRNIHGEAACSEVIRYIHCNPVKRGLVASPEQYQWSSFNPYATGARGVAEIESEWTARLRGPLIAMKLR
uniref:Transposase n=1 Tax=mine drainage metagenome TaxID=410659 RepID=E6PX45_9ZZZZ